MTGHATPLTMAAATAGAAALGGPLSQVLNELAVLMAIMGGAGGLTWGLANRYPWRDWLRGVILGALMAFGFGLASPSVLDSLIGVNFAPGGNSASWLASCAFVVGMMQDWVLAVIRRGQVSK